MSGLHPGLEQPHFHVCPKCLHIWSHTTAEAVIAGMKAAHRCPACQSAQGGMGWGSVSSAIAERAYLRTQIADKQRGVAP